MFLDDITKVSKLFALIKVLISLTVNRVVLEEVHKVVEIHEWVVDSCNLGLSSVRAEGGSEGESSNSSESVDSESDSGHA